MSKKCLGCGVRLQTTNPNLNGYVPEESLNKGYCRRCFRLTHYHQLNGAYRSVNPKEVLASLEKKKGICFFLCDFLNFNEEAFNYYKQIKLPKCFVVSKCDIIPKNIYYLKIKEWLRSKGILEEVIFVSSKYEKGLSKLKRMISESSLPVYFLGMTNSGKSSLLNTLFLLDNKLTVSELPNTTLDFVRVKDNVYDSVGLPYKFTLDTKLIKDVSVNKEIRAITMPVKKDASILIKDLVRLEVDNDNSITCFFSEKLKPKKVYPNNKIYLDEEVVVLEVSDETNLYLKGIGFFYIKHGGRLKLYHVTSDMISITSSFMGGK